MIKTKILYTYILLFISVFSYGQLSLKQEKISLQNIKSPALFYASPIYLNYYIGTAYGLETHLSAPKIGLLRENNYGSVLINELLNLSYPNKSVTYLGYDFSFVNSYKKGYAHTLYIGIRFKWLSINNSFANLHLTENTKEKQWTYSPKIGFKMPALWLQAGPSFVLSKNAVLPEYFTSESFYFSVELVWIPLKENKRRMYINPINPKKRSSRLQNSIQDLFLQNEE